MASVMCVRGPVQANTLGFVLPHEHLFVDITCYCPPEPEDSELKPFYHETVSLANREQVVNNPWGIVDNARLDGLDCAIEETRLFTACGGNTIADLSPCPAMGRNPQGLLHVSEVSGINVIMSSGRYTLPSMSESDKRLSVADLEKQVLDEFINSVEGIQPGLLKTGFVSKIDDEAEIRSLRAVSRVQHKVGCAVSVHPYIWEPISHRILDILEEEGCDLRRVILCHQDYLGDRTEYIDSLIKRGANIEFDTFGCGWINDPMWQQTDQTKINFLQKQIDLGNIEHVLISGDICLKLMLTAWGGSGYAHIPQRVVPAMKAAGFSDDMVRLLTSENAARIFCH